MRIDDHGFGPQGAGPPATTCFTTAVNVMASWAGSVREGRGPTLFPVGTGPLSQVEIGPGLIALLGGQPGAGKTALVVQLTVDALRLTPTLRAVIGNVEMTPEALLDRQLARLSGVPLDLIRHRRITPDHADAVERGLATLDALAGRLAFVRPPVTLKRLAEAADEHGADLLVCDYVQRIAPLEKQADRRAAVDAVMDNLRRYADAGVGIFAVSAVGRGKDARGRSSYDGDALSLASFRESSELEYGADSAYIIAPNSATPGRVALRCLKNRHGEAGDIDLTFDGRLQRFTPVIPPPRRPGRVLAALADSPPGIAEGEGA